MDARASYSWNIANYCRQAITNIQHPQPKSHPIKIPEVVDNLEQVAQNFRTQIDQQNRIGMFTDNLHAQCRFDTTRQVLSKMREHRKILEKKDQEIRNQNELIKRLQEQSFNQQIALDNMKIGVSADRQIRIQRCQEIARLGQELAQKDRLIRQQEFMIKNLYKNCQIAEKHVHDLQKASPELRNLFTGPRDDQVGSLWLELRRKIEAPSEDPNKITDSSNGEPAAAPPPGMLETKTTTPEVEDAKVEICMVKDEDLYSAN